MLPFWDLRHHHKEKDLNGNEWGHWAELKRAVEITKEKHLLLSGFT